MSCCSQKKKEENDIVVELSVGGMSCGSCAAYIESKLPSAFSDGVVRRASVDFATKIATVTLSVPAGQDTTSVCHEVASKTAALGYTVKLLSSAPALSAVAILSVGGMSCTSCSNYIEENFALKFDPSGRIVRSVKVDFPGKEARISFARNVMTFLNSPSASPATGATPASTTTTITTTAAADLAAKLNDMGFTAAVLREEADQEETDAPSAADEAGTTSVSVLNDDDGGGRGGCGLPDSSSAVTAEYLVQGMTCASCSARIESHLNKKVPGVVSCNVNFAMNTATVKFIPSAKLDAKSIQQRITDLGYAAVIIRNDDNDDDDDDDDDHNDDIESGGAGAGGGGGGGGGGATDPHGQLREGLERKTETEGHKWRFIAAALLGLPLAVVVMTFHNNEAAHRKLIENGTIVNHLTWLHIAELIVSSPLVLWVGRFYYIHAWSALRTWTFTMDTLVTIGVLGSYVFSLVAMILSATGTARLSSYFETSSTLLMFMLLGKFLEARAKRGTSSAILKLMDLAPPMAIVIKKKKQQQNGSNEQTAVVEEVEVEEKVPTKDLRKGQLVRVLAGERIPVDGTVVRGCGAVDESSVTGESVPQEKEPESAVIGGTMCVNNDLVVRADKVGSKTMLSQIIRICREAQGQKPAIQRTADAVAGVFVPVVIIWALVVLTVWLCVGLTDSYPAKWRDIARSTTTERSSSNSSRSSMMNSSSSSSSGGDDDHHDRVSPTEFAFSFFISAIVIACPCALGLATPTAVMVGIGVGATFGVLIKGGPTLEAARAITMVLFDKTGTLTTGSLRVTGFITTTNSSNNGRYTETIIRQLLGTVESRSTHPIARALTQRFGTLLAPYDLTTEVLRGAGVRATLTLEQCKCGPQCGCIYQARGLEVLVGSMTLMRDEGYAVEPRVAEFVERSLEQGRTVIAMAAEGRLRICVALADEPKPESAAVVRELQRRGIKVAMVSGDNAHACRRVAAAVGIDPATHVFAQQLPADKAEVVRRLQQEDGERCGFVGDGVNDSPALSMASVGIAMGAGTEVAIESADAVLVRNYLPDILTLLDTSDKTVARIRLNFAWAFGYNLVALPLASGVFFPAVQWQMPPIMAGAAMVASSLTVLASSLLLRCSIAPAQLAYDLSSNSAADDGGGAGAVRPDEPDIASPLLNGSEPVRGHERVQNEDYNDDDDDADDQQRQRQAFGNVRGPNNCCCSGDENNNK